MLRKNIYISGFMGTGKSCLGKGLSLKKNLPFKDLDQEIERKTQKSISEIFAQEGETSFRRIETQTLLELNQQAPLVVSLGGGAILSITNRHIIDQGVWINLNAQPRTIFNRINQQTHRPLLNQQGQVDFSRIKNLLQQRQPFYELAPWQIITDGLSEGAVLEIVSKIV